jgi:hypothetical protein
MNKPTASLQITTAPSGEAPDWVRQAWVGLVLPLAPQYANAHAFHAVGVLTGPRGAFGHLAARLFGRTRVETGYPVESKLAIEILEARHLEAAAWWREHTPHMLAPSRYFLFDTACGHIVE